VIALREISDDHTLGQSAIVLLAMNVGLLLLLFLLLSLHMADDLLTLAS
jgi:hypothetical protein